jgi:hypothetical protein
VVRSDPEPAAGAAFFVISAKTFRNPNHRINARLSGMSRPVKHSGKVFVGRRRRLWLQVNDGKKNESQKGHGIFEHGEYSPLWLNNEPTINVTNQQEWLVCRSPFFMLFCVFFFRPDNTAQPFLFRSQAIRSS